MEEVEVTEYTGKNFELKKVYQKVQNRAKIMKMLKIGKEG
jgi:hypothetical protein